MIDRRSVAELRLAEALAGGDARPEGADTFAEAVARAPRRTFGPGFAEMVAAAEAHPDLAEHLPQLVTERARLRARRAELAGAAAGPIVTLMAALAACAVTAHLVVPRFAMWLSELDLPSPGWFDLSGRLMQAVFGVPGIAAAVAVGALALYLGARGTIARWSFVAGPVAAPVRSVASRTLAIATRCGVSEDEALALAAAVVSHRHASAQLRAGRRAATGGTELWQLLSRGNLVPPTLLTGIRAADGKTLSSALDALADYFSVEAEAGRRAVRTFVGTGITIAAALMCKWVAFTIATGYPALLGTGG